MNTLQLVAYFGFILFAKGGPLHITTQFIDGDVSFFWNGDPWVPYYDLSIGINQINKTWYRISGRQYTVKKALLYDSVSINVRVPDDPSDNKLTYKVSKIESNVNNSVKISWTAPYFPRAGEYTIYHTNKVYRSIISVYSNDVTLDQTKYEYHSRPLTSTNISFEIKDITPDDAGYYNGGTKTKAAWSGGGVVLIVHNKPSKPKIQGNINILVGNSLELTCTCTSSSSTTPEYYARLHPLSPLSYTWFVNSTQLYGETNKTLKLRVTRNYKYNQYSCTANDKLVSDWSDPVIINPLYTSDKLTISPRPSLNLYNKLPVKEGESIGPYTCTADCNPPCDMTWKYKDSTSGGFFDVASSGLLIGHIVNRSIALYRCIAQYSPDKDFKVIENIILDVHYLDEPQLVYNENSPIYTYEELQVQENTSLHLHCHVNSNPTPTIRLHRGGNANVIAETNSTNWLNHTIYSLQCSDSDEYTCTGDLRLNSKDTVELINGFKVGSQRTVIIKVPVIAYPPPVTSRFSWVDPKGQMINRTNVALLKTHEHYSYLITSVVLLPEVEHYGEYSVQYNGKSLTKIPITKRGGPLHITTQFIDGDVSFFWNGDPGVPFFYLTIGNNKTNITWYLVYGRQYTVKNALLYDSISINVRAPDDPTDNKFTYKVSKIEGNVENSVKISWTAPFFPKAGDYIIYHTNKVNRSIISVCSNDVTLDQTKYEYHSRPLTSTNISFEIKNITPDDAGYYNGGTKAEAAGSGGGVVLIVHNKPSKPNIHGNRNILVGNSLELTCTCNSSSSTTPEYYARLHPLSSLSYTWYVNNTQLYGETNKTLRLRVTRNHKYNQYSCTSRDKLESDRSDPVKINPMYTSDKLTISPRPSLNLYNKLPVKEGETIGPYTCTADCNPPCDMTWKYKDTTSGGFFDVASTALLGSHFVNRSIALYRCIAQYSPDKDFKIIENIILDVYYLDEPQLVYNENSPIYTYEELQVQEKTSLHLYCHCSDSDEYTCTGESTGLSSKKKVFRINVNCDLRLNSKDTVELIKGFEVGSQRTVIIKIPVIAYPPPVTSRFTWVDPKGQMINGTNVALLKTHEHYSYLITSVVLLPEVEHYGEYSVQYNGKPLTKIPITKRDNLLSESERKSTLKIVTTSHDETRRDVKTNGQENQNVLDLEIEKLKLENRKLHEEIQRTQLEKETLQAARNLYNAKLMLILKENKEIAPSIVGQL
uniref:Uncharacterized protein LOC111112816 isoform X3 n=1 Tax=Crassostrea virginica TaxID=6565 RepID=A0A8B8BSP2_CRAVI|nr:uncharacterized protein LOC111112816 isoform X3 [Crassostrea virginica]